jgi:hypothetical protein
MKSEIGSRRSEVSGRLVVTLLAVFAAFALNAGAGAENRDPRTEIRSPADLGPRTSVVDRPLVQPDCKVANGARSFGVKVDLVGLARAKRPTKTVYVEEAVALWRPGYGELIAAAGAGDAVADVNAAVSAKEVTVEKGWAEIAGDHFRRNAGKYVGTSLAALLLGGAWYLYDQSQESDGSMQTRAAVPSAQSPSGSQSPAVVVSGVNLAPGATITINIDQPYASE